MIPLSLLHYLFCICSIVFEFFMVNGCIFYTFVILCYFSHQRLVFRHKLYQLREERDMRPETFASLVSAILYEKRELAKDFVVAGTTSESLYGACESMFKPEMEQEELFETISQALLSYVDRDCLSGWGGHVYVVIDIRGV